MEKRDSDLRQAVRSPRLETSTTAGVVDRLEARGLLLRSASSHDRRVRLLTLTPPGEQLLFEAIPRMQKAQELILAPLSPSQHKDFLQLLNKLLSVNNGLSRVSGDTGKLTGRLSIRGLASAGLDNAGAGSMAPIDHFAVPWGLNQM